MYREGHRYGAHREGQHNPRYLDCLDNFGPSHQMYFYIMLFLTIPLTGCELCWLPTEKFTSVYFSCIGRDIGTAPIGRDNITLDILTASIILDPATKCTFTLCYF